MCFRVSIFHVIFHEKSLKLFRLFWITYKYLDFEYPIQVLFHFWSNKKILYNIKFSYCYYYFFFNKHKMQNSTMGLIPLCFSGFFENLGFLSKSFLVNAKIEFLISFLFKWPPNLIIYIIPKNKILLYILYKTDKSNTSLLK